MLLCLMDNGLLIVAISQNLQFNFHAGWSLSVANVLSMVRHFEIEVCVFFVVFGYMIR